MHHGVGVGDEVSENVNEALFFHQLGVDVMQLGHADGGSLADVGVVVPQALAEWLTQVLGDFVHPDATHRSHCQRSN